MNAVHIPAASSARLLNRSVIATIWLLFLFSCSSLSASQENLIRIGTGGPQGTYYPIGGLISQVVSDTEGYRQCLKLDCGEIHIVAVHQASNGSIANASGIQNGHLEAGLVQSDVAHWAFTGTGVSQGKNPAENLRAIASLYTESVHLVARKDANIRSVLDLNDKRVSLDEPGSGTLVDATIVLNAYGLVPQDLKAEYIKAEVAKSKLLEGRLDAFFIVGGFPVSIISELAATDQITLVPIHGPQIINLLKQNRFFSENVIPENTYPDIAETKTIGVGALLLVSATLNHNTVFDITKRLWSEESRKILAAGHKKGAEISISNTSKGVSVPFHKGALAYYRESGISIDE